MTQPFGDQDRRGTAYSLEPLRGRSAWLSATSFLIAANLLVAGAMFLFGAGLSHTSNSVQLAWGANFGPATKDGEWWRLATAMFLHFGPFHLAMNMLALWDGGRLAEKMYGPHRFCAIFLVSGLTGNLLSLIVQGDRAVSGGASGAIFGVYGALLVFLLFERRRLHPREFRWMFWGAAVFAAVTLILGLLIPGIDNAAHLGGMLAGAVSGFILAKPAAASISRSRTRWVVAATFALAVATLVKWIPEPRYSWSEEQTVRGEIHEFIGEDARINSRLRAILAEQGAPGVSFDQLAGRIEAEVAHSYELSFEQLSSLRVNPDVPSAATLARLRRYAEVRRDASQALAEGLREKDSRRVREALNVSKRAALESSNRKPSAP